MNFELFSSKMLNTRERKINNANVTVLCNDLYSSYIGFGKFLIALKGLQIILYGNDDDENCALIQLYFIM